MTHLSEINKAIRELNELWQTCTNEEQCKKLLEKRDALDAQSLQLSNKVIREGTDGLTEAMDALKELTQSALNAKNEVNNMVERINKTAGTIDKATQAIAKVAVLMA